MLNRTLLFRMSVILLLLVCGLVWPVRAADPPNVLLILTDDMGYADLSYNGSRQVRTPHIDRIAESGVYFEQAYVTGVVCAPSRCGLISGRYQNRFGAEHNWNQYGDVYNPRYIGIPADVKVMSEYIKERGYATAMIGKWHVGEHEELRPEARGFDHAFWMGGNHTYWPKANKNGLKLNGGPVTEIEVPYLTDWWTQDAIDWMTRDHGDQPWFIYLGYNTPHTPMQAKPEDEAKYQHIADKKRRTYLAMQDCLDQNIGKIFKTLEETGQLENTLIVFTNDNGGPCGANASINAPFRGQKSTFLEGGMRVPMMISWPAKIDPGTRYPHPVVTFDLLTTILAAIRSPEAPAAYDLDRHYGEEGLDGVNLFPYFSGKVPARKRPHETIYWRTAFRGATIREGDWKLIVTRHDLPYLYNIAKDPQEMNDRLLDMPEKAREMKRKLGQWEAGLEATPTFFNQNNWLRNKYKSYTETKYILKQPAP